MHLKKILLILLVVLPLFLPHFLTVHAADVETLSIQMIDGEEKTRNNKTVLVAGIWHYLNITTDQDNLNQLSIQLYKGTTPPTIDKNETNYYEWIYDSTRIPAWAEINGYGTEYIQPDFCIKNGATFSFYLGIKDMLPNIVDYYENWTLSVTHNNNMLYTTQIIVEKVKTGISKTTPTSIKFIVEPFTEMNVTGDAYFKVSNAGNIPLYLSIDYAYYNNLIEINDFNKKIPPEELNTHYITLFTPSWPPSIREITLEGLVSYPETYFVDTNATVTLYPSFILDIPLLQIFVGHSGYTITELFGTNIVFQYLEKLTMYEGEIRDINAYVSGNNPVILEIWADEENIRIQKIFDNDIETTSPISFLSTNTSERVFTIRIEAVSEGKTGILNYKITAGNASETYTTQITIGPPQTPTEDQTETSDLIIRVVVLVIIIVVVGYLITTTLKHKRR